MDERIIQRMDAAVAQNRRDLLQAQTDLASTWGFPGISTPSDVSKRTLDQLAGDADQQNSVAAWAGPRYGQVLADQINPDDWFQEGKGIHDLIEEIDSTVSQWSFGSVASGIADATAQDLRDGADKAAHSLVFGLSAVAVAWIIASFLLLYILLRQGVSGSASGVQVGGGA